MIESKSIGKTDGYVYDISLDGTFVNALGMNVLHNTDGFNFKLPDTYRYTEENPYVSTGKGRNTIEGKKYTGVDADVAEFEDIYMCEPYITGLNKMGLGIDEFANSTINFSRKNYADYLEDGSVKLVGNSIKSKKMPLYIEKFLDGAIRNLLYGKGHEFLKDYYDYIDKIYNLRIPLKEIASVGKIKKSVEEYKRDCSTTTAAGTKKARQAWYELVIKNDLSVNMGDTIYYINTGKKKSQADVKRITHYYIIDSGGVKVEITKEVDKLWTAYRKECKETGKKPAFKNKVEYARTKYDRIDEWDEIIFNCVLLPNAVFEDEDDTFCDDNFEYNVEKYIEQFNSRIKALLVCFSKDIRDKIIIKKPDERQYFTEEESVLVSGEPKNPTDQDTYEQLMTMEDKEIMFWMNVNKKPPYTEECGMDWEDMKRDYTERMERLKSKEIEDEVNKYNQIISKLTMDELDSFIIDGIMPGELSRIVELDVSSNNFKSIKHGVVIGNIFDIIDKDFSVISNNNEEQPDLPF